MPNRFTLALLTALACLWAPVASAFDLQAHRGGRGLWPENTLAAFENALRMGVTTLELDIAVSADGVAVVSHDPALQPALTRDAQGRWLPSTGPLIHTLTLAQVQAHDVGRLNPDLAYGKAFPDQQPRDGERIPTLADVFRLVQDLGATAVRFNIETKVFPHRPDDTASPDEFVRILLETVRAAGLVERVAIQSFDWRTLRLVRAAEPRIRTVFLTARDHAPRNLADAAWTDGLPLTDLASLPQRIRAAGGAVWSPHHQEIDAAAVRAAQALGLQVVPWTANEVADLRRLLDWKVDGIITDRPDRLRALMRERGLPLPAAFGR